MIEVKNIQKKFENTNVLKNVSFSANKGEFITFIGESGCGKTTLLRLIAGLQTPESGTITFNTSPISKPYKECGMVFQDFSLFPWLTVEQNIAFPMKVNGYDKKYIEEKTQHYLEITGLTSSAKLYPSALSGGMKQRVAIARTLANNPELICMDEPFSALDALTKTKMQTFLLDILHKENKTIIFVTHDVEEAIFLSDRIFFLDKTTHSIKKEFLVHFAKPRTQELKNDPKFIDLKKHILSFFNFSE